MTLRGKPIDAAKKYKVAGWAPVSEEAKAAGGEPIWDVMARYLRAQKTIAPRTLNLPQVEGVAGNPADGLIGRGNARRADARSAWLDARVHWLRSVAGVAGRPAVAQKMPTDFMTPATRLPRKLRAGRARAMPDGGHRRGGRTRSRGQPLDVLRDNRRRAYGADGAEQGRRPPSSLGLTRPGSSRPRRPARR